MGRCASSECAADYNRRTGGTLAADLEGQYVYGPARARLEQWQDGAVKDIVSRISTQARQIKPNVVISIDGHATSADKARPLEGRDELDWTNSGLINVIFNMDYACDCGGGGAGGGRARRAGRGRRGGRGGGGGQR